MFRRIPTALVVTIALLISGAGGIAVVGRAIRNDHAVRYEGNARRFLDLTTARSSAKATADGNGNDQATDRDGPGGGDYTPAGWRVRPAGDQIPVFNFPLGLAATPDEKSIYVSSDNGGMQGISTIETTSQHPAYAPSTNLFLGLSPTPSGKLYASGGNANRIFRYRAAGASVVPLDATQAAMFPIHHGLDRAIGADTLPLTDGIRVTGYPGLSVMDGVYMYVAGTLSEPSGTGADACPNKQAACARVTVVDTTSDTVLSRVPVGLDAYGLALDSARHRLYVTNWADEAGRAGPAGGSVSVVDITDPMHAVERAWTRVGHHPTALQLTSDGSRLFVTNTNDDTISVLDVSDAPKVVSTESVKPLADVPVGAHPNALALSPDGDILFVSLPGMNAVEVRDGHTGAPMSAKPMYIPTGWYPSALLVTGVPGDYKLWIANAKGAGVARKSTGLNMSVGQELPPLDGTVSVVRLPVDPTQATKWTAQVADNDHLIRDHIDPCGKNNGVRVSQVLCPPKGQSSPVKHVVYIVTENKTFDQYFGDLDSSKYDVGPQYILYGQTVTPNHHALASRFSLSDRFFSDAQVSRTGHSYTSGAVATDHMEKLFPVDYDEGLRGNHGNGDAFQSGIEGPPGAEIGGAESELDDPEGGYIFEAFQRAGAVPASEAGPKNLSMAIYGESTARESGHSLDAYKAPSWQGDIRYFDTCRADLFTVGHTTDGPWPDDPEQIHDCGSRTMPPQFNLAHWTDVKKKTGVDVMPNFLYLTLPVNHTMGTSATSETLGNPTPASMVADNDNAIGMIVSALSKSPFWESTVVMQTEDDTQLAGDHVSPLRDYLEVSGPWAKPGPNHQWGSMGSLLRTIEQIFGVDPISLNDRLAFPQHGAFRTRLSDKPDIRPYDVAPQLVPYAINRMGAPGQAESNAMDWSAWDRMDMEMLNAILYADARGTPFVPPKT